MPNHSTTKHVNADACRDRRRCVLERLLRIGKKGLRPSGLEVNRSGFVDTLAIAPHSGGLRADSRGLGESALRWRPPAVLRTSG
jgi:hypothetical protein